MDTRVMEQVLAFFGGRAEIGIHDLAANDGKGGVFVRPAKADEKFLAWVWRENKHKLRHVYVRPVAADEPRFMLVDDLTVELLRGQHGFFAGPPIHAKPGRMIVETSPGCFQVWIHAKSALSDADKRFWLSTLRSDPGAAPERRWGRLAGFLNVKPKHQRDDGSFPLARLVWMDPTALDVPPAGGQVGASSPTRARVLYIRKEEKEVSLDVLKIRATGRPRAPENQGEKPDHANFACEDRSRQDFLFVLACFASGMDREEASTALRDVREVSGWGSHNNPEDYVGRTVAKAADVHFRRLNERKK
jgi:hypothetical protein